MIKIYRLPDNEQIVLETCRRKADQDKVNKWYFIC
jgi:hypothetical protein